MDDDFEYGDEVFDPAQFERLQQASRAQRRTTVTQIQNQPHDEEVALSESESIMSPDGPPSSRGAFEPSAASQLEASADSYSIGSPSGSPLQRQYNDSRSMQDSPTAAAADQSGSEAPSPSGQGAGASADVPGAYNPADFSRLNVSEDIQDLFKYIGKYRPPTVELPTRLKPFIPEFIPAIGGTDEFIKVPRPDGRPDYLGLKVLDEPAAVQSDPTLLNLQLRQLSKDTPGVRMEVVGCIEHNDKDRRQRLATWISSIADLHKNKPAAAVHYSRPMPDLEVLMQEWPPELEAMLRSSKLPTTDLDLDLLSYSKLVCALLDVPVYDNVIESLHVLFSLLLEFKQNPFFRDHLMASSTSISRPESSVRGSS
ncbi:hypothetical protein OEZ85_005233 [Tetradesmus obliquus]|uniref:Intraflagellar transport protein 46 homolog n=1 Tax=Tetradesmus obliquus TaxID=3088 RepID=A0ABY8UH86_TETOB|nr:hypothetical protein OEZ85_005233 [Tetradesmus obliquus]